MSDTANLSIPLLDAAQAQKHVTVNEALVRLDAVAAGRALTSLSNTAPGTPDDGELHIVGAAPLADWAGHANELALRVNGGWEFIAPPAGLSLRMPEGRVAVFDGMGWTLDLAAASATGAATLMRIIEEDHVLAAAATSSTGAIIPDKAVVIGVTARVIEEITDAASWSLGVSGSPDRYGAGFGGAAGTVAHGVTGSPLAYYGGTPLVVTAGGGAFTAGRLSIAVHLMELRAPTT